jgi:uncharacterized protein YdeI (YjbR/CyaY-like superfamily)
VSDAYPQVPVEARAAWRAWLEAHHAEAPGVWVVTWKKASGGPYVAYEDLVEEALCFGWVDSKSRGLDAARTQLLMTPRKPASRWSRPNKERITRLQAAGRMAPAGLAAVELAKESGTWTGRDEVEAGLEPADLRAALDADADARRHWDAFPRSTRRAILEWITAAKRPETREKRVRETAEQAARDVRANQWRRPEGR